MFLLFPVALIHPYVHQSKRTTRLNREENRIEVLKTAEYTQEKTVTRLCALGPTMQETERAQDYTA